MGQRQGTTGPLPATITTGASPPLKAKREEKAGPAAAADAPLQHKAAEGRERRSAVGRIRCRTGGVWGGGGACYMLCPPR